jgi:hypothetical protein
MFPPLEAMHAGVPLQCRLLADGVFRHAIEVVLR